MLAPFSSYPVIQAFERLITEDRAVRTAPKRPSLARRIVHALSGLRARTPHRRATHSA